MLAHLSRQTIRMQEEERTAISRELHDEVGQMLATISINLQLVKRDLEKGTEAIGVIRKLDRAQVSVGDANGRIRRFLSSLRPVELDDIGLSSALVKLTEEFSEQTGIRMKYSEHQSMEELSSEQKIVLYRVIQESLSNIMKHADANEVNISITRSGDCIHTDIRDNGNGFDYNEYLQTRQGQVTDRQLGLLGMKERVKLAHGECSITSEPGKGTCVHVRIPVPGHTMTEKHDG